MEGFASIYRDFLAESESLVGQFNIPLPEDPTFEPTCQVVHGHGRSLLTVWLQNAWGGYCRSLLQLSVTAEHQTLSGRTLSGIGSPSQPSLKHAADTINAREGMVSAVWHRCQYVIWVAQELGVSNVDQIAAALSPVLTATRVTRVRNYVVHPNSGTREQYLQVTYDVGNPDVDVAELLLTRQPAGASLFELWVRELQAAAENAAQ